MVLGQQSKHNVDPSKVEVGEIDTSSPFESVKHAVSLFGAVAFTRRNRTRPSAKKPESPSSEKVSVKESKLHLAEKELNQLKQNLRGAEFIRSQTLAELDKTRKTIKELNKVLSSVIKSKEVALEETDELNKCVKNVQENNSVECSDGTTNRVWKTDMDTFRVQYLAAALELSAAKQKLGNFRLDYDSAMRSYNSMVRQATEAEAVTKANNEAVTKLSDEISGMKELIEQAKIASEQAEEEKVRIEASRETLAQEHGTKLDDSTKSIKILKITADPEASKNLQRELHSVVEQSFSLKQDIHTAMASDSDSELAATITLELENVNATLQKLVDEEAGLRRLIESLTAELENVKMEISELNKNEAVTKHLAEELEAELRSVKLELEAYISSETNARSTCDEMTSTLVNTMSVTKRAQQEAKEVTSKAETFMKKAEADKNTIKEYEDKLQELLQEVEATRSAEANALEEIKLLSETKDSTPKVTISKEDFKSLNLKVKDSATIADMKVSVAMVQVEAVNTRRNYRQKLLENNVKELDETKLNTAEALKTAEDAEACKIEMENELINLGYHKNLEIDMKHESSSIGLTRSFSTNSATRRRITLGDILKMDREGREKSRRSPLRSLSGIFHRS